MSILKGGALAPKVSPSAAVKRPVPPLIEQRPGGSVHPAEPGPQTRLHIEHLERQLMMEKMRTKELGAQLGDLDARLTVLREAGNSDLVEDYEGLDPEDVVPWVERVLLPAYGLAVAKLKGGAA